MSTTDPTRTNSETLVPDATMAASAGTSIEQQHSGRFPLHARKQLRDAKHNTATTRTNAALAVDSWTVLDETVTDTYHQTVRLIEDLRQAGLEYSVDFMAEFDFWQTRSDHGKATVGQHVEATTSDAAVSHGRDGVPIPAIHDDFAVRYREGAADGALADTAEDFDTVGVEGCSRRVAEAAERLFIGDEELEYEVNDGQDMVALHGITTHPNVPDDNVGTDWADDPSDARDDVRNLRSILKNDNLVRPGNVGYNLYVGTEWYDALDDYELAGADYPTGQTMRDAIEGLANINSVTELDFLGERQAFMLRPTSDVIQVGVANDMQTLQWDSPFSENFKVLASMHPRIKITREGQSGIVVLNNA